MKIVFLELINFTRMALNNVKSFSITITDPVQLILGTNGSGKSSLLAEMSPLPAETSAFANEGSKTIKITHQGNNYTLKSTFSPKASHSFEENGEELNKGGTAAAQRDLVRMKFNYTAQIHELLIGRETFPTMSPQRRREWFTLLSDVSYDYALSVYGRLKERNRDLSGALKLAKKRLVAEVAQVITQDEEDKLRQSVAITLRELNLLIEQSAPLNRSVFDIRNDHKTQEEELLRLSNRLLRMRLMAPYGSHPYGVNPQAHVVRDDWGDLIQPGFTSLDQIDSVVDKLRHEVTSRETLVNKAVKDHERVSETLRLLTQTGQQGIAEIQEKITTARTQRDELLAQRSLPLEGFDGPTAFAALQTVQDNLRAIFEALPENEDRRFTQAKLQEAQQEFLAQTQKRAEMANVLSQRNASKQHLQAHKENNRLQCPKCNHVWIAGYSDDRFEELLHDIEDRNLAIEKLDKDLDNKKADIAAIEDYARLFREYGRCTRNWTALQPFWDYLAQSEIIARSPRKALSLISTLQSDLELLVKADSFDRSIVQLKELLVSAERVGDASMLETQAQVHELTVQIESLTGEITRLRHCIAEYSQYRKHLFDAIELGNKISSMLAARLNLRDELVEAIRRETLNHCTKQLQHSLAIKQETLNTALTQKELIKDLQKQIDRLTIEEQASKLLLEELSPSTGLIAEGLIGFIRDFTQKMNSLIRKIWAYPLQIMDCSVTGDDTAELDYKFPMLVQSKNNIVPDVKSGSAGMQQVISLAFNVVAMHQLGLSDSPLFLDEFASAFDKQHKTDAMQAIKNLIEQQAFSQLFLVSHDYSFYGSLSNVQVCVLDARNIVVPVKCNEHVVMT